MVFQIISKLIKMALFATVADKNSVRHLIQRGDCEMMQGSIKAIIGHSYLVSQRRISRALRAVAPMEHEARAHDLLVRTNPFRILHLTLHLKCIWIKMKKMAKTMAARVF